MDNRLKELRKAERLTQEDLAKDFYLTKGAISHYEKGKRDIPNFLLPKFADYFNVSIDYLLCRNNPKRF